MYSMLPSYSQALITYLFTSVLFGAGVLGICNKKFYYANVFHPHVVYQGRRLWTLFSSCLIHVGWRHLLANTAFFLIFLSEVEYMLVDDFGKAFGRILTSALLVSIVVICNLVDLLRFRNRLEIMTAGLSAFNCAMIIFYYVYFPLDGAEVQAHLLPITTAYEFAGTALLAMGIAWLLKLGQNPAAHLFGGIAGLGAAVLIRPQLVAELIQHFRP